MSGEQRIDETAEWWWYPADISAVPAVRATVRAAVAACGMDRIADDAGLVATELVANAVLHARTDLAVRVSCEPAHVRIEVWDGSAEVPVLREPSTDQPHGRGMWIVRSFCSQWGCEPSDDGKVVWVLLPFEPASPLH